MYKYTQGELTALQKACVLNPATTTSSAPLGSANRSVAVTQLIAGNNITLNPTYGMGRVVISATGGGAPGTYVLKVPFSSGKFGGVPALFDPDRTPIVPGVDWTIIPNASSITVTYPATFTGVFTNFKRYDQNVGTNYTVSHISSAGARGQYCVYNPMNRSITFYNLTSSNTGIRAANSSSKMYITFEYVPNNILAL